MTTLIHIIEKFSDDSGNIVIQDDQKESFLKALLDIRKPSGSSIKKKKYKKDPNAPKRATSAYMIWLNKNRDTIKSDYFDDYIDVTDWTLESKCNYYKSKGMKIPTEDGKPRIVALVTAKAGLLWKSMTIEDKTPYDNMFKEAKQKYETLKESYVPIEQCIDLKIPDDWDGPHFNMKIEKTIKDIDGKTIRQFKSLDDALEKAISLGNQCFGITQTKRGFAVKVGKMTTCSSSIASWTKKDFVNPIKSKRGRPKSNLEDSDDESNNENMNNESEAETMNDDSDSDNEEGLEVEECVIDGKKYYKSSNGELYHIDTSEYVGKYVDGSISLE